MLVSACVAPLLGQSATSNFDKLANDYIAHFLESRPAAATFLGEHRYDDRLNDVSPEGRARDLEAQREFLKRAQALQSENLDRVSRVDLRILTSAIESTIWDATVSREFEWNPMSYNPGYAIYYLLEREFAPLPQRLKFVRSRLDESRHISTRHVEA